MLQNTGKNKINNFKTLL